MGLVWREVHAPDIQGSKWEYGTQYMSGLQLYGRVGASEMACPPWGRCTAELAPLEGELCPIAYVGLVWREGGRDAKWGWNKDGRCKPMTSRAVNRTQFMSWAIQRQQVRTTVCGALVGWCVRASGWAAPPWGCSTRGGKTLKNPFL